ncbi:hypothetical protein PHYSODRAFT_328418 [Phytophthora sojae]|uniref:Necrosis inducing-like protein NPP1 type n=1 Tax=Phytophthora sojae (strain P6497) TaxID=1094619 RepID=G4Z609_PHYSP|nr:hypothetical protein PHYSODRAFT_328418 [Phytophthora sojae]EGZ20288.1 hypothetical protein PHYSODRAFT_328418 [Phytophthora sojae]|eukprot:XP_009523005.1 hypothetical protein PHYSODRAFT_328418 [Phytophthora sojae]
MKLHVLSAAIVSLFAMTQVQSALEPGQKAAVKFKPQLKLSNTCHPYAAVDAHGYISGGLNSELHIRNNCGGSDLGAQIYARSAWHSDVWATVYAWYFPKNSNNGGGPRSLWMYAIIWVGGPGVGAPEVVGATLKTDDDTEKHAPVDADYIDGTSFECKFTYNFWTTKAKLTATKKTGGYQDLITWEQLPEVARTGLAGYADMPLLNGTFEELLTNGWPF